MKCFEVKIHYHWKCDFSERENNMAWNVLANDDLEAREKAKFLLTGRCRSEYDAYIKTRSSEKQTEFQLPKIYFCEIRLLCHVNR